MRTCTQILRLSNHLWPTQWRGLQQAREQKGVSWNWLVLDWSSTMGQGSAVSQTEQTGAAGRQTVGPDGLCRGSIRGGSPVINFLGS